MKKLWYSWEEIIRDMGVLCRDMVIDHFEPDVVVGLSRGGLTPGIMLSHWLKKPFKPIKAALRDHPEWEDYLPKKTDKRILIVDDICDSGETFEKISSFLNSRREQSTQTDIRFASLWWNNECSFEPHYYAQECAKDSGNIWIHFPWEHWWNAPV